MAKRRRKASIETKVKRTIGAAVPVVVGVSAVGLGLFYFGSKPGLSQISSGLNGGVQGAAASSGGLWSWFGF